MNQGSMPFRSIDKALALGIIGTVVGLIGLLACCAGLLHVAGTPKNGIRVEQLEREIHRQLPLGSTRGEVEEWFASRDIEPSEILAYPSEGSRPVGLSAEVPNGSWLEDATIRIEFYFDRSCRLKDRIIYRWAPSL
jgi:hypothetical protein